MALKGGGWTSAGKMSPLETIKTERRYIAWLRKPLKTTDFQRLLQKKRTYREKDAEKLLDCSEQRAMISGDWNNSNIQVKILPGSPVHQTMCHIYTYICILFNLYILYIYISSSI